MAFALGFTGAGSGWPLWWAPGDLWSLDWQEEAGLQPRYPGQALLTLEAPAASRPWGVGGSDVGTGPQGAGSFPVCSRTTRLTRASSATRVRVMKNPGLLCRGTADAAALGWLTPGPRSRPLWADLGKAAPRPRSHQERTFLPGTSWGSGEGLLSRSWGSQIEHGLRGRGWPDRAPRTLEPPQVKKGQLWTMPVSSICPKCLPSSSCLGQRPWQG